MREQMLARVNRERTSRGLAPLRRQPDLDETAPGPRRRHVSAALLLARFAGRQRRPSTGSW